MSILNTPGVYVQEIPTFPPSVVQVATAIPAFIGYTKTGYNGTSPTVQRINSLMEYEAYFGTATAGEFSFSTTSLTSPTAVVTLKSANNAPPPCLLYYAVAHYFQNGGGSCYIVSIGNYSRETKPTQDAFVKGLNVLAQEDEPTLILFPDAVGLGINQYSTVTQQALDQCHTLGDRFLIVDVPYDVDQATFRNQIASPYLNYAAAYYPYLTTTLSPIYDETSVQITAPVRFSYKNEGKGVTVAYFGDRKKAPTIAIKTDSALKDPTVTVADSDLTISVTETTTAAELTKFWNTLTGAQRGNFDIAASTPDNVALDNIPQTNLDIEQGLFRLETAPSGIAVSYKGSASDDPKVSITTSGDEKITFTAKGTQLTISAPDATQAAEVAAAWEKLSTKPDDKFDITKLGEGTAALKVTKDPADLEFQNPVSMSALKASNIALYNKLKSALNDLPVVLPPSAAIAGIYARVDRDRGVWKTPANVPVLSVIAPVTKISDADQDLLNVDVTSGKSINAIRSFTGRGTLVWGGRTLDGTSNEWRYISVRRLFITIEESARKATAFAVFEPNDATTWLKVKAMIESYLYGLWEQGALAGPKPEAAFFVSVGLGKTMTPQDVLEGRMIVRIGIAAVRPAEFIILQFTHKLQEA